MQAARAPPASTGAVDESAIEKTAREEIRREKLARTNSAESVASSRKMPLHGLPDDPEAEIDEIVREVKAEIELRRRRGSVGFDVKKAVQEKLKQFQKKA